MSNHIIKENRELSILVSLYGLSFVLYNPKNKERKFFEYSFDALNPERLEKQLNNIIKERPVISHRFDKLNIIHHNRLNTFVPAPLFEEEKKKDYLSFNVKLFPTDFVDSDFIKSYDTYNIYIPFVNINNLFLDYNEHIEYEHSGSVFLKKVAKLRENIQDLSIFEVYVNIFPNDFQILVLKNEKMILYNHFEYTNEDDFLYYFFFVVESLNIPADNVQYFIGGISSESPIIKHLKTFSPDINVIQAQQNSQINNWI